MTDRSDQVTLPEDAAAEQGLEEHFTGVPGCSTWRGVYYLVLVFFVVCVVLLKAFELVFS